MTKRELRHLFIINLLLLKIRFVIRDANAHLEQQEQAANAQLQALLEKQVQTDGAVLDCWQGNVEELWQENQNLQTQIAELREKLNAKRKLLKRAQGI